MTRGIWARVPKAARLLARLRKELDLDLPATSRLVRTYAGACQRSAGAWVWVLEDDDTKNPYYNCVGSQWPITYLLRGPLELLEQEWGDLSIFPGKPAAKPERDPATCTRCGHHENAHTVVPGVGYAARQACVMGCACKRFAG